MSKLRFVGLDVHKDTIVIAVAEEGQAVPSVLGTFPHDVAKVVKQLGKLVSEVSLLRVCYEAGPTGFGLCRRLQAAGMECVVVAPSLVPQQAGARVKTDRRDAARLAHFLRSGDLTAVWVPDEQTEALRDLERSRDVSLRQNQSREETLKREESLKEKSPSHTSSKGERLPSRRRYDHQEDARPHPSGLPRRIHLLRETPARRVRYFRDGSGHAVSTREYQSDQQSFPSPTTRQPNQSHELTNQTACHRIPTNRLDWSFHTRVRRVRGTHRLPHDLFGAFRGLHAPFMTDVPRSAFTKGIPC